MWADASGGSGLEPCAPRNGQRSHASRPPQHAWELEGRRAPAVVLGVHTFRRPCERRERVPYILRWGVQAWRSSGFRLDLAARGGATRSLSLDSFALLSRCVRRSVVIKMSTARTPRTARAQLLSQGDRGSRDASMPSGIQPCVDSRTAFRQKISTWPTSWAGIHSLDF